MRCKVTDHRGSHDVLDAVPAAERAGGNGDARGQRPQGTAHDSPPRAQGRSERPPSAARGLAARAAGTTGVLLGGGLLGALLVLAVVGLPGKAGGPSDAAAVAKYTCSMHPQIVIDHPDVCPICGMDLTPVGAGAGDGWEEEDPSVRLVLSASARRMADVGSAPIQRRELFKEIRTVGKVAFDETRVADVAARLSGSIAQVFADFPGTRVREGERLASIFNTEVLVTQHQYLISHRQEQLHRLGQQQGPHQQPASARSTNLVNPVLSPLAVPGFRLRLWGMTEKQLDELARSDNAQDSLVVCAPMAGTILEKKVRPGQYVKDGDVLFTIADLSQVWVILEVYESELFWVRAGQAVEITLESEPHRPATGKVGFVEPVLTESTRAVRVRVVLDNPEGRFKPGMYAQALVRVPIQPDGSPAPTGLEGKYLCSMHPLHVSDGPGECSRCRMPLAKVPGTPASDPAALRPSVLAVPAEAVLTTGRRQLVYVEAEPGKYQLAEPKLGPRAGDYYPVLEGLEEGQRVVTRGSFLLDSQFQITGKTSLLYARRDEGAKGGHACCSGAAPDAGKPAFTAKELANFEKLPEEERPLAMAQRICPITGKNLGGMGKPYKMEIDGRALWLCCKGCEGAVKKDPEAAFAKTAAAAPEAQPGKKDPETPSPETNAAKAAPEAEKGEACCPAEKSEGHGGHERH